MATPAPNPPLLTDAEVSNYFKLRLKSPLADWTAPKEEDIQLLKYEVYDR